MPMVSACRNFCKSSTSLHFPSSTSEPELLLELELSRESTELEEEILPKGLPVGTSASP